MKPSPNSEERDAMLYFHYNLPPKDENDRERRSLQGVIKEEEDGTFVVVDLLQHHRDNGRSHHIQDSLVMRLPHEAVVDSVEFTPVETTIDTAPVPSPPQSPEPPDLTDTSRPGWSTELAVGLGVNLLALLAGAYLWRVAVPTADLRAMQQAEEQYDRGQIAEAIALAKSVSPESEVYAQARSHLQDWQQEQQQLDTQARTWIEVARQRAKSRDFPGAIAALERIPSGSSLGDRVTAKLAEYRQKQDVRAAWLLQRAYDAAARKDFTLALDYLQQIPPGTTKGDRVREKLAQYRQQQNIRATWLLQRAYDRAVMGDFEGAIDRLQQIPSGTQAYSIARAKLDEYRFKASQRS
jgi:hypothetical protein